MRNQPPISDGSCHKQKKVHHKQTGTFPMGQIYGPRHPHSLRKESAVLAMCCNMMDHRHDRMNCGYCTQGVWRRVLCVVRHTAPGTQALWLTSIWPWTEHAQWRLKWVFVNTCLCVCVYRVSHKFICMYVCVQGEPYVHMCVCIESEHVVATWNVGNHLSICL